MKKTLLATLLASLFVLTSPTLSAETYGEASIEELKSLAAAGDVTAMNALGRTYDIGNGVEEDDAEAVTWFRKAAEQGSDHAQFNLGVKYVKGEGVKKDLAEGLKWVKKAAEQGNPTAQGNVPKIETLIAIEKETAAAPQKSDTDSSKSAKGSDNYTDNGDGTVTDTKTKLMWKQCSEGQSGKDCSGEAAKYKWDDAMSKFGKGVSFAGHSDWRMPTMEELPTLVYCSNGTQHEEARDEMCGGKDYKAGEYQKPTINQKVFPNTNKDSYWSSTEKDASDAWDVSFDYGHVSRGDRDTVYAVRLVRSGQ